jgi:hypothetical protein
VKECGLQRNLKSCTCSYEPCERKGACCECVAYHRRNGEVPGCLFPESAERTYDRSIRAFVRAHS